MHSFRPVVPILDSASTNVGGKEWVSSLDLQSNCSYYTSHLAVRPPYDPCLNRLGQYLSYLPCVECCSRKSAAPPTWDYSITPPMHTKMGYSSLKTFNIHYPDMWFRCSMDLLISQDGQAFFSFSARFLCKLCRHRRLLKFHVTQYCSKPVEASTSMHGTGLENLGRTRTIVCTPSAERTRGEVSELERIHQT